MKKVAGTLKIDQAQYRELESFSKFSSDMDPVTAMTLDKGRKNNRLLIQAQYSPMPVGEQVAILYCGTKGLMKSIDIEKVPEFQELFLERMRDSNSDILEQLSSGHFDESIAERLRKTAEDICVRL